MRSLRDTHVRTAAESTTQPPQVGTLPSVTDTATIAAAVGSALAALAAMPAWYACPLIFAVALALLLREFMPQDSEHRLTLLLHLLNQARRSPGRHCAPAHARPGRHRRLDDDPQSPCAAPRRCAATRHRRRRR
jgi:hypothetical protein